MGFLLTLPTLGWGYSDRIVAVVNKDVITWSDLQHKIRDEKIRLKAKYQGKELERRYHEKQREVLNDLIDERLQFQEAKERGLSVSQQEIDAAIRRSPLPPGQTEEEFGRYLLLQKLFEFEVRQKVVVEDEEILRFYEDNPALFRKSPQYRLKQILFYIETPYEKERALAKAQKIYREWTSGGDLEELANRNFAELQELGWVRKEELLTPLAQTLKNLPQDILSQPIQTDLGVHLLLVEEIQEAQQIPLDEVERDIKTRLSKERAQEVYRNWLAQLKEKAFIDVKF